MGLYRRYIKKSFKLGMMGLKKEPTENLWVGIKKQISMGAIIVGVCCRPTDQEEQLAEAFYRELEVASCSQVPMRGPA